MALEGKYVLNGRFRLPTVLLDVNYNFRYFRNAPAVEEALFFDETFPFTLWQPSGIFMTIGKSLYFLNLATSSIMSTCVRNKVLQQ